jgi:hypothetical protein
VEYEVAFARARKTAAMIMVTAASRRSPARTTNSTATATRKAAIASKVANDPRCSVGPEMANSAAAKKAACRPNRRLAVK